MNSAGDARLPPGDPVYGSPGAADLLDAVEHFLRHGLQGLDAQTAFEARVAANVVGLVARQQRGAGAAAAVMAEAYGPLGAEDEASLAVAVRRGDLDDRAHELHAALRRVVRCRLDAVNPFYGRAHPKP